MGRATRTLATSASVPIAVLGDLADRLLEALRLAPERVELPPGVVTEIDEFFGEFLGEGLGPRRVRIRAGSVPGIPHGRAFALPHVVYLAGAPALVDGRPGPVLIHELTHVWQARHRGYRYIAEALYEQVRYGRRAYDWRWWLSPDGGGRAGWSDLPVEAQAQYVMHAHAAGGGFPPRP